MSSAKAAAYLVACRKYTLHSREDVVLIMSTCLKIAPSTCAAINLDIAAKRLSNICIAERLGCRYFSVGQTSLGNSFTEHVLLSREMKSQYGSSDDDKGLPLKPGGWASPTAAIGASNDHLLRAFADLHIALPNAIMLKDKHQEWMKV